MNQYEKLNAQCQSMIQKTGGSCSKDPNCKIRCKLCFINTRSKQMFGVEWKELWN